MFVRRPRAVAAVLALAAALVLAVVGCGGHKPTFTYDNFGTLMSNPHKYEGAHVDIDGQVFLVDTEQLDSVWVVVYADPSRLTWEAIVKIPDVHFQVQENKIVHIVGVVRQNLPRPTSVAGFDIEPVILASKWTLTNQVPPD